MELDPRQAFGSPGNATASARTSAQALPRCPQCGWQDVRHSHTKTPLDHALTMFSILRFRCRSCNHRFYRFYKRTAE